MFFRARRAMRRAWFDFNCRALLDTPPIISNDDSFTLVSMTCHGELMMYLLAAKSFCRNFGSTPNIILLDDGSLTKSNYPTITSHIPNVKILHIEPLPQDPIPQDLSW